MHDTINGAMFKEMLLFGTVSIAQAQQAINDLNVFPVPDGDTGTNMSLTMGSATREINSKEYLRADMMNVVLGARGPSSDSPKSVAPKAPRTFILSGFPAICRKSSKELIRFPREAGNAPE